jgi:endonuclease/exonuclease/phosphatase family metal-dependent hydrolase
VVVRPRRRHAIIPAVTDTSATLIDTRLRVVTWNLWWRFGPWKERERAIAATLAALDPDVVCLQEVWIDETTGASSARAVADALGGFHVALAHRHQIDGIGFGNAVVSRWPIAAHAWEALPAGEAKDERRCVLRADVSGPRGVVQVFTTHLNWRMDHSAVRQEQVRALCRFVRRAPARSFPAVLCGDLNAGPDADEIRMLTGRTAVPEPPVVFFDAWEKAGPPDADGCTWSERNPHAGELDLARRIDYVLVGFPKAGGAGHVTSCSVIGDRPVDRVWPSDHFGVLAELRY